MGDLHLGLGLAVIAAAFAALTFLTFIGGA